MESFAKAGLIVAIQPEHRSLTLEIEIEIAKEKERQIETKTKLARTLTKTPHQRDKLQRQPLPQMIH